MLQYHQIEQLALDRHRTFQLEAEEERLRRSLASNSKHHSRRLALWRRIGGRLIWASVPLQKEDEQANLTAFVDQPATPFSTR